LGIETSSDPKKVNMGNDDALAAPRLAALSIQVDWHDWKNYEHINWRQYDMVVIRSTWDYMDKAPTFLAALETIEANGVALHSPLRFVRDNVRKTYLTQLANRGVRIIPSRFVDAKLEWGHVKAAFDEWAPQTDAHNFSIIVKPQIGAGSEATFRVKLSDLAHFEGDIAQCFVSRGAILQPYRARINIEGEYSVVLFNGRLSHAIVKVPKKGDFRAQAHLGADHRLLQPNEERFAEVKEVAEFVMKKALDELPLYARVDLVRGDDGLLELMELELIEPYLALNKSNGAPERFAEAIAERLAKH